MKSFWGDNENDLAVDKSTPLLIRMLALCLDVLDTSGEATDGDLLDALNLIDVQERLIDALSVIRDYQKRRENEMNGKGEEEA